MGAHAFPVTDALCYPADFNCGFAFIFRAILKIELRAYRPKLIGVVIQEELLKPPNHLRHHPFPTKEVVGVDVPFLILWGSGCGEKMLWNILIIHVWRTMLFFI